MGSLCVVAFCRHFGINHRFIDEWVAHQIELLRCDDLSDWSTSGTRLAITGLGDAIPDEVVKGVPENLRYDFQCLLESSTEIGTVDLFGGTTDHPSRFLSKCCSLLAKHQVPAPVSDVRIKVVDWGRPLDAAAFEHVIEGFRQQLEGCYPVTCGGN